MATFPCDCGCFCDFGKKQAQGVQSGVKRPAAPPKRVTLTGKPRK